MATMPAQVYVYRARLVRVVDGDTADIELDCGLHAYRIERLRLLGINCPEVHGPSRPVGLAATAYAEAWFASELPQDWPLVVQTTKTDDFGRYLGTIWRTEDGACLNDDLLASGNAVPFMEAHHA